ncbi:MAG: sigma-54 dependent transcriptional regulator [Acidobacteriota bacterium]
MRVLGLTILYHPDLSRIGESAALLELMAGRPQGLSRLEPQFRRRSSAHSRSLDDLQLSRSPVILRPRPDGGLELDGGASPTVFSTSGGPVGRDATLGRARLEEGVVLFFGERVVLLVHLLDTAPSDPGPDFGLLGESPAMLEVRRNIRQVSDLDVPVLLRGETGTGKELVARAIHRHGDRRGGALISVNMAAVPTNLAASELFGAVRGAFTGADRTRRGFFQEADGGTLFLDEVGESSPEVQALLLRALETGEIQEVGGGRSQKVDVRLISATDRVLEAEPEVAGQAPFKAPLLHRLSGFVIQLPPLRARREDFGRLLVHFLRLELGAVGACRHLDSQRPWLPPGLVAGLASYAWPGNVRQLRNVVRQLVIAHRDVDGVPPSFPLDAILMPLPSPPSGATTRGAGWTTSVAGVPGAAAPGPHRRRRRSAAEIGDAELLSALRGHRWRLKATADALGLARSSLYDRINRHPGIRKACEIGGEEILASRRRCGGNVEAMADELEVSARALRRRMGQLGL